MKKNKKKVLTLSIISVLVISLIIFAFFAITRKTENSLTLTENKWIESNKHDVIDVSILNDIPILSYDGEGVIHDYLDYITKTFSLEFNVIPNKLDGDSNLEYTMNIVSDVNDKDLLLLKDNMILITNSDTQYTDINSIENLKLGILSEDRLLFNNYFIDKNIQFVEYNSYSELKKAILDSKTNLEQNIQAENQIDGIIILKTLFTKEMIEQDYNISYQFNNITKNFVLTLNGPIELNNILKKLYNAWEKDNYNNSYNTHLLNNYFNFKNISDVEERTLKSKSYVYGFVDYGVYNYLDDKKISGLVGLLLKDFNSFSGISITYTRYNSISMLLKDFNSQNVDFVLNIMDESKYVSNIFNTTGAFDKNLAIISGISNDVVIDDINSLKGKEVLAIKDSNVESLLVNNQAIVKSYNNLNDLAKDFNANSIAIIDLENYNFYKTSYLKDTKINYLFNYNDKYNFIINDIQENITFSDLFNFYVSFTSINRLTSENYESIAYENKNITYILIVIIIILILYVVLDFSNHLKVLAKTLKKNKKVKLSKADKIRYIDQLTSLKNRAYLNSKIESWDDSDVYPQSIIIIDLNNISYINDNYGREEGDKVITEAANILIQHQLQNSEIIRTDGNEFLIYLVGYNEKQIISYLRKLNKELKNLSHGFGAASGYSIITDAIKTVDDAVNEATLDMKNNKEDINY